MDPYGKSFYGFPDCTVTYDGDCLTHHGAIEACAYRAGQLAMRERAVKTILHVEQEVVETHGATFVTFTSVIEAIRALEPEEPK